MFVCGAWIETCLGHYPIPLPVPLILIIIIRIVTNPDNLTPFPPRRQSNCKVCVHRLLIRGSISFCYQLALCPPPCGDAEKRGGCPQSTTATNRSEIRLGNSLLITHGTAARDGGGWRRCGGEVFIADHPQRITISGQWLG